MLLVWFCLSLVCSFLLMCPSHPFAIGIFTCNIKYLAQNSVAFQFCSDLELRICLAPCFNRELDFGILNNTDTVKDCNDFIGR